MDKFRTRNKKIQTMLLINKHLSSQRLVLLTIFWYAVFRFVLVEKTKSAKNIWEPVFENVIILGFLMADTSNDKNTHIFLNMSRFYFILSKSHVYIRFNIS